MSISRDIRHLNSVDEFSFKKLGAWGLQRWRHVAGRCAPSARQGGTHRGIPRGQLKVRISGLKDKSCTSPALQRDVRVGHPE